MKFMRSVMVGGACLLATATTSYAQSMFNWVPNGLYVRGDVGGAFGNNTTFRDNSAGAGNTTIGNGTLLTDPGNSIIFGGGVGYRFLPFMRGDFTLDYAPSFQPHGTVVGGTLAGTNATGSAKLNSLVGMGNLYLDFGNFVPGGLFGPTVQPYVDGGIGFARNSLGTTNLTSTTGNETISGSTTTNFAWGVGGGVNFQLTPSLSLDAAYKYLDLGELKTGTTTSGFGAPVTRTGLTSNDFTAHTVTVGLRWTFGAPPAPPAATPVVAAPPAPPPAAVKPAKQMFIVFFEFDKSSLTPDGKKVVDAAAAAFKSGKSDVALAGYTDLAGTQQYNLALSKRRADTVKAALVKDGVPAAAIGESWYGKQNPRVPTADGVREPQNRRVEITM
jgi:OOP family OmpA-OmpF porin